MAEDVKALQAKIEVVDAKLQIGVELDLIDLIDDALIKINPEMAMFVKKLLEAQREELDWKGVAKELL